MRERQQLFTCDNDPSTCARAFELDRLPVPFNALGSSRSVRAQIVFVASRGARGEVGEFGHGVDVKQETCDLVRVTADRPPVPREPGELFLVHLRVRALVLEQSPRLRGEHAHTLGHGMASNEAHPMRLHDLDIVVQDSAAAPSGQRDKPVASS